jgi:hypothetical protein
MNKPRRLITSELSAHIDKRFGKQGEDGVMWIRDGVQLWRWLAEGTERGIARAADCHPNSIPRGLVPRSIEAVDFVFVWTRDNFRPVSLRAKPGVAVQREGLKLGLAWKFADPWSYYNCPPWYIEALDAATIWRWHVLSGKRWLAAPEEPDRPERSTAEFYVASQLGLTTAALRAKLAAVPAPLREFFEVTLADGKLTDLEGLERLKDTREDCGKKSVSRDYESDKLTPNERGELEIQSDRVVLMAERRLAPGEKGSLNRPGSIERREFFVPIAELWRAIFDLSTGKRKRPDIVWPSDAQSGARLRIASFALVHTLRLMIRGRIHTFRHPIRHVGQTAHARES